MSVSDKISIHFPFSHEQLLNHFSIKDGQAHLSNLSYLSMKSIAMMLNDCEKL